MFSTDLQAVVGSHETIVWQGKPDKKCFILESIFNPLLPFALLWAAIDLGIIGGGFFASGGFRQMGAFGFALIPFFLLHMMPVWLYLGGVLLAFRKYRNTEYIVTNLGVYISGGAFSYSYELKPFAELSHVALHRGIFDQWLGVGDVELSTSQMDFSYNRNRNGANLHKFSICDIPDYQRVYKMVKDMQTDIYSDTMYPNDLRPAENHGYQTRYTKIDDYRNDYRN